MFERKVIDSFFNKNTVDTSYSQTVWNNREIDR